MYRTGIFAAACTLALAGCSGSSTSMPDWLSFKSAPPADTLRFESQPPGAEVRTAQGQVCRTPCALAVPLQSQAVTFSMNGYVPQTIAVQVTASGERSEQTFESEPPGFAPNPVEALLEQAAPSRKPAPPKKRPVARPKPAANTAAAPSAFPPPPPMQPAPAPAAPAASPFPPPPR